MYLLRNKQDFIWPPEPKKLPLSANVVTYIPGSYRYQAWKQEKKKKIAQFCCLIFVASSKLTFS
jgi:hypothetical protein